MELNSKIPDGSLDQKWTKYKNGIAFCGDLFSVVIPTVFAAMPVSMYMGWVH